MSADKDRRNVSRSARSIQREAVDQTTGLIDDLRQMEQTPGSGVAVCHAQGKTAVYLSRDRKYIVEHPPHGPITRTPVNLDK